MNAEAKREEIEITPKMIEKAVSVWGTEFGFYGAPEFPAEEVVRAILRASLEASEYKR